MFGNTGKLDHRGEEIPLKVDHAVLFQIEELCGCNAVLAFRTKEGLPTYTRVSEVLALVAGVKKKEALDIVSDLGIAPVVNTLIDLIEVAVTPEGAPVGEGQAGKSD